jgi:hypothetical protein
MARGVLRRTSMVAQTSLCSLLLSGLVVSVTSSCAHVAPVSGAVPTRSAEGVELAVAGDSCDEEQEPDWYGWNLTELLLQVRVSNPTGRPIAVRPSDIGLRTPDGTRLNTVSWGAASPLAVSTGETKSFDLRFMNRGSLHCGTKVELDTSGSIRTEGRSLTTDGIVFTASSSKPLRL